MTLVEIIRYMNDTKYNAGKIGEATYLRHNQTIQLISSADVANTEIDKITLEQLRTFLNSFIYDYSDSSIGKIYTHCKNAFRYSEKHKYIVKNIMEDIEELPKPSSRKMKRKVEALTIDEQRKLISVLCNEECCHKYKDIILLMLYTGMRIGEILALNYTMDFNFDARILIIHTTLTRDVNGKCILGRTTKTYTSSRIFPITPIVERILRDALYRCSKNRECMLFWDYENDTFIDPSEVNSYLKRIAKKYKICKHIHNHMLRHTYATRCIESGMPAVVLQKKLGHKDVSITLNTYTSVFDKFEDKKDDEFMEYLVKNSLMI